MSLTSSYSGPKMRYDSRTIVFAVFDLTCGRVYLWKYEATIRHSCKPSTRRVPIKAERTALGTHHVGWYHGVAGPRWTPEGSARYNSDCVLNLREAAPSQDLDRVGYNFGRARGYSMQYTWRRRREKWARMAMVPASSVLGKSTHDRISPDGLYNA